MLTSKQRSKLKGLAANLQPIAQIGKDGLNENIVQAVSACLDKYELVKVQILENCPEDAFTVTETLAARLFATVVIVMGRKGVIYRKSDKKGVKHIEL